jgi:hypothetical protein
MLITTHAVSARERVMNKNGSPKSLCIFCTIISTLLNAMWLRLLAPIVMQRVLPVNKDQKARLTSMRESFVSTDDTARLVYPVAVQA